MELLVELLNYAIAGSIASWLAHTLWGSGPLGVVIDLIVALVGATLGVFTLALVAQQPVEKLDWWFSIPVAFIGAISLTSLFRVLKPRR